VGLKTYWVGSCKTSDLEPRFYFMCSHSNEEYFSRD